MSNREQEARGKHVIEKFRRDYERDEAKAESLEENMKKGLADALKRHGDKVAKEFMRSKNEGRGEDNAIRIKKIMNGDLEMTEEDYIDSAKVRPDYEDDHGDF